MGITVLNQTDDVVVVECDGERIELPIVPGKGRDERRSIYEAPYKTGVIQFFKIHAAKLPLGMHYHRAKDEVFTIVSGGGYVLLSNVDTNGQPLDENDDVIVGDGAVMKRRQLAAGAVVEVTPFVAHTFYLTPGSEMTCISSLPFDLADMLPAAWLVQEEVPAT